MKKIIKSKGIILKRKKYKENSGLIKILSEQKGVINLIAHRLNDEKSGLTGVLEPSNLVDLVFYYNDSSLSIIKEAEVEKFFLKENRYKTNLLCFAAIEFIEKLTIDENESEDFFLLLKKYLEFIPKVKNNQILIFWRFVFTSFKYLGIFHAEIVCANCGSDKLTVYNSKFDGFLCENCENINSSKNFQLDNTSTFIIKNIFRIGNFLDEIVVDSKVFDSLNQLIMLILENSFHINLKFFSLRSFKHELNN